MLLRKLKESLSSIYLRFFVLGLGIIVVFYFLLSFGAYFFINDIQGKERAGNKLNVTKLVLKDEQAHLTATARFLKEKGDKTPNPQEVLAGSVQDLRKLCNFDMLFYVAADGKSYALDKAGNTVYPSFENNSSVKLALTGKANSGYCLANIKKLSHGVSGDTLVYITSQPILDKSGIYGAVKFLSEDKELMQSIKAKIKSDLVFITEQKIAASTSENDKEFFKGNTLPEYINMAAGPSSYFGKDSSGRLITFEKISDVQGKEIGAIGILVDMQPVKALNASVQKRLLLLAVLFLLCFVILYIWLARNVFRRVFFLQNGINKILRNDLSYIEDNNPTLCWQLKNCSNLECPAWNNRFIKCWQIEGTGCDCKTSDGLLEELGGKCKKCPVYNKQPKDEVSNLIATINLLLYRLAQSKTELQDLNKELIKKNNVLEYHQEELRQALNEVSNFQEIIYTLAKAVETKDEYTHGHSERVAHYAEIIARALHLEENEVMKIYNAAILHDIGKIGISDVILNKPAQLTDDEFAAVKLHSELGESILSNLAFAKHFLPYIKYHHEWYNGKGYPEGLKAGEIPLGARILAVADAFDAMTSDRPYRKGMSVEEALKILQEGADEQWDSRLVAAFVSTYKQSRSLKM